MMLLASFSPHTVVPIGTAEVMSLVVFALPAQLETPSGQTVEVKTWYEVMVTVTEFSLAGPVPEGMTPVGTAVGKVPSVPVRWNVGNDDVEEVELAPPTGEREVVGRGVATSEGEAVPAVPGIVPVPGKLTPGTLGEGLPSPYVGTSAGVVGFSGETSVELRATGLDAGRVEDAPVVVVATVELATGTPGAGP